MEEVLNKMVITQDRISANIQETQSKVDLLIGRIQESTTVTHVTAPKSTLDVGSAGSVCLPTVLLIGTSNIQNIKEDKLTAFAKIIKRVEYTLDETYQYIVSNSEVTTPDLVLLHSFTNDIKKFEPNQCVDKMDRIIGLMHQEWPSSKIIISLATPRADEFRYHTNGQILNALLKQHLHENPSVSTLDHSYMLHEGDPPLNLLCDDGVHLNEKGVYLLASNMKRMIHNSLGIETVNSRRPRSKSRGRFGFGKNRGSSRRY
jgi:lysophospholipase L1-like esterase